jgi:O-methyltransferase
MMETGEIRDLYLDLMKKALTHSLWTEGTRSVDPSQMPRSAKRFAVTLLTGFLKKFRLGIVRQISSNPKLRALGEDWPEYAHTMIGMKRLNNIQECVETVIRENVPGDLIETGVWRGGAVIFMRAVLKAYGVEDRNVWAADSFCGLPRPDSDKYPADRDDICYQREFTAVSLEEVKANFEAYNLLDGQVRFLPGWFKDTLPDAPIERLALLRLDGDMYQSTLEGLTYLYPKLSEGGFVIVDDYAASPCRQAVEDFRNKNGITDPVVSIDNWSVYWRRS